MYNKVMELKSVTDNVRTLWNEGQSTDVLGYLNSINSNYAVITGTISSVLKEYSMTMSTLAQAVRTTSSNTSIG